MAKNYMDLGDVISTGVLQEVNRLFFHRLGLALEIVGERDGSLTIAGISDHRPEGIRFGHGVMSKEKADNIGRILSKKKPQPIPR